MSLNLFHAASTFVTTVPVADVARGVISMAAVGGLAMFFRPLLTGIGRALVLTVRPRPTRAPRAKAVRG